MNKLYDYTNGKKVFLESFDNWFDAERALDTFKKNNPSRMGFIAGRVKGNLKLNIKGCPVNRMDLIGL